MTTAVFWVLGCCLLPGAPPERSRPAEAVDTLVVCAPGLRPALQPWLDYRAGQGHQLAVLTDVESPAEIRTVVRRVARQGRLQHLVLVGDVQLDPARRPFHLPTYLAAAKINPKWGSEPELATDCWFGDLDDDAVPDLAVGRLPADSPADLTTMIRQDPAVRAIGTRRGLAATHQPGGGCGWIWLPGRFGSGNRHALVHSVRNSRGLPNVDDLCQLAEPLLSRTHAHFASKSLRG